MEFSKAQLVGLPPDTLPWLIACSAVAALWAGFRPDMVRGYDGRRLPPSVSARLTFVVLFVAGYVALTAAFLFLPTLVNKARLFTAGSGIMSMFVKLEENAPVLAILVTFGLYSLAPFREIERNALAWMHSTSHLRGNILALTHHLQECDFVVTPEEQRRNIVGLETFGVYVTDVDTKGINLSSAKSWRKTASLLRRLREWNSDEPRVLSQVDWKHVEDLEKAHSRKTGLAMDIIRMLEHIREGGEPAAALSNVSEMLAGASHRDRREVAALEDQVKAELQSNTTPASGRPVRLTSSELQEYLKKIEGYFHVEYRLILAQVSELAAKSVVRAGDAAADRLEELKTFGFQDLGSIRPISTHRILWLFLSVALGGFLIYYVLWYPAILERLQAEPHNLRGDPLTIQGRSFLIGIAFYVTSIAFAALVGALFGSNSAQARSKETPWGRYLVAGLIATAGFFLMQAARELLILSLNLNAPLVPIDPVVRMTAVAPWFVMPFLTAVTICWLARQRHWQFSSIGENTMATLERMADGVVLGVLMLPGYAIAVGLAELFVGKLPPIFLSRFDPAIMGILCLVGFFVGATVVRDVRSAAHAQIIAPKKRKTERSQEAMDLTKPLSEH